MSHFAGTDGKFILTFYLIS